MAGRFRKVEVRDNWGHLSYTFSNGETFKPTHGQRVYVKFPDGRVEPLPVKVKPLTHTVSDMGHDYVAKTEAYVLDAELHGVPVEISVTKVLIHDTLLPDQA